MTREIKMVDKDGEIVISGKPYKDMAATGVVGMLCSMEFSAQAATLSLAVDMKYGKLAAMPLVFPLAGLADAVLVDEPATLLGWLLSHKDEDKARAIAEMLEEYVEVQI